MGQRSNVKWFVHIQQDGAPAHQIQIWPDFLKRARFWACQSRNLVHPVVSIWWSLDFFITLVRGVL